MEIKKLIQKAIKLCISIYNFFIFILFFIFVLFFYNFIYFLLIDFSVFFEWDVEFINGRLVVMGVFFDWIVFLFIAVVSLISFFIMSYSKYYMDGDKDYVRFVFILFSFISSMFFLILSPNIIRILLGWDGLGLRSYALVIYYQNESSANSGIITVLRNRVGDVAILLTIGWVIYKGSWNFFFWDDLDYFLVIIIILASFTKRAQIPFSAWLPAAIAAPTPVSSLVHSSTLVTAGVFLLIRFREVIGNLGLNSLCFVFGVITTLISGWVANYELDIKKVVALSTLRQLGIIFMVIGLGSPLLGFFHLIIHALFKSTLFMCTGFVIHNLHDSQDIRLRGLFSFSSPVLGVVFGCTNIALCGFPFIAGFYSKDSILEIFFSGFYGLFILLISIISVGLTISYSLRFLYNGCNNRGKILPLIYSYDLNKIVFLSVLFLFFFRIFSGFFLGWFIILKGGVFIIFLQEKFYVIFSLFFFSVFFFYFLSKNFFINKILSWFFSLMFFLPFIRKYPIKKTFFYLGRFLLKEVDKGWFEYSGPIGVSFVLRNFSFLSHKSQLVFVRYFIFSLFFFIIFIFIVCLKSFYSVSLKLKRSVITLDK